MKPLRSVLEKLVGVVRVSGVAAGKLVTCVCILVLCIRARLF